MRSNNPKISVIIPTYNRAESLKRVVEGILNQTFQDYEIIVVDDGSTDETESTIKELQRTSPRELLYFKQENKGAGAARNLGIKHARGELVLFMDDDVLPTSGLLEEHVSAHGRHPGDNIAIVGAIDYAPESKISPFMRWLILSGPHFWHSREQDGARLDYKCFCTANISLNRQFMITKGMFDESLRPFFEDIELGYRLDKQGLQLILSKKALGYHLRSETLPKFCDRVVLSGQSAVLFFTKWPEADMLSTNSSSNAKTTLTELGMNIILPITAPILKRLIGWLDARGYGVPPLFFPSLLNYYFNQGLRKGLRQTKNTTRVDGLE